MALTDLFKDLDPTLADVLDKTTRALRAEFDQKLELAVSPQGAVAVAEPAAPAPVEEPEAVEAIASGASVSDLLDPVEELKHAVTAIDACGSQGEVLEALVAGCARFSSRVAVFLLRGGDALGWGGHGFDRSPEEFKKTRLEIESAPAWAALAGGSGAVALSGDECRRFTDLLSAQPPQMGVLLPFVLGNQPAAAIYCDRLEDDQAPQISALQILTFVASQVLENLPVRDRDHTATLRLSDTVGAVAPQGVGAVAPQGVGAVAPQGVGAVAPQGVGAVAPPSVEPVEIDAEPAESPIPPASMEEVGIVEEPLPPISEPEPPAPSWPEPTEAEPIETEPELVETTVPAMDQDTLGAVEPPEPMVQPPLHEEAPPAPTTPTMPVLEPSPEAPAFSAQEPQAVPESPAPDIELDSAPAPTPVAPPATPVAPPTPPTLGGQSSTQVSPPDDVKGPGWAFTTSPGATEGAEGAEDEEARRLARLLVTEIKLYNEEQVEQGRLKGNVYALLREDVDRSRQIFEDRIDDEVRGTKDYFHEACVRILAGGDPSVLGF